MKSKRELIKNIKELVSNCGGIVTTGDMQSESSPMYSHPSKDHYFLVEKFTDKNIGVVEYIHQQETSEFNAEYSCLKVWQLREILMEIKEYSATYSEE